MPARTALVLASLALLVWFNACSSGLGHGPRRRPTQPSTNASSNRPVGVDLGVIPTDPAAEPAVAGFSIPAYGSLPARDVVLLAFTTAANAADGDGAGNAISRDAVTDANGASDVFLAAVCSQDVETRAFSQSLAGKFRHPRCTTCHSMQAATTQAFASSPLPHAGPPPGPGFPNNDPGTCAPCHVSSTAFPVPTWQAPAASFDMRTETVEQLADRATRVPAGDTEHFVSDARVLWALDSGILPTVGGRNGIADDDHDGVLEPEDEDGVPRTVPGGSVRFIQEIQDWNASGRVVTAAAAVRDVTLVSRASGGVNAGNGASRRPKLLFVANPSFNPATPVTAASTNPVGTVYVVFESDASDLTAGDANGATDVYRAVLTVRVEEDATGAALAGGINLVYQNSTVLCSATNGTTTAGNGASTRPAISGTAGQFVAFQSTATNLIAGFTDANGADADVYLRRIGVNTTQLVSHNVGNAATGGNGASESPAIDASAAGIAFESDASDLIAADLNGVRDVFHVLVGAGSPFTKVRDSVTNAGAEATGGASSNASIFTNGSRVLVAFQSDATNLAPALTATTNVFLFDSANGAGATTLLNQRVASTGDAIGNGSASTPVITPDGSRVVFASAADNIDVLRTSDGNRSTDLFLVETAQLFAGNVLPFRVSMTVAEAADANGSSSSPAIGSFASSASFQSGFLAYTTNATNLGTSDSTKLMVSFLNETSGVFADFTATPVRGAGPLAVQFTDTSSGQPTQWQWDFDNDGTVDSTEQNPSHAYTAPGTYTVKLTAANANTNGSKTATDFVLVVGTIVPDFTVSATNGVAPLVVNFTDTSTESPTSWAWDFENDGIVDSTVQNPQHTYSTPGTYTVKLTATNEVGSVSTTKTNVIEAFAPVVAGFTTSTSSGIVPFTVNFTNTSTGATTYSWDFGDGGTSTATSPSHQYTVGGSYTVTLTATGPGGVDTATTGITANSAVAASFTMTVSGNPITSAYEATSILFTSTSTGSISTFAWDFDFVANPGALTSAASSLSRNFPNTTTSTRVFAVRLTVSGPGGVSFAQQNLTIVSDTETAALNPVADSTIYQEVTGNSAGGALRMIAGRTQGTGGSLSRRALLRFNLSSIPASSTISAATLQLTHDTPLANGSQSFGIHRVTASWVEGSAATGSTTIGTGAATAGGGATWANRTTGTPWGSAGGDFTGTATASISVPGAAGSATSGSLVTDVQAWVNGTANNGWLLRGTEGSVGTVKRFLTRETGSPPTLNITFTRPLP